ncbi:MAG: MarC family protein [Propionibacteriaceae bacterium]|nr:MarC family protein [Propionibacteriaceae bacterium]
MNHGHVFLSTFVTLWVILDPPGLLPVFLGLTKNLPAKLRHQAALRAGLVATAVIAAFAIFGQFILLYLKISVEALQISGGLLLLLVALELLMGKYDQVEPSASPNVNIAIVPLGTPLLAGPGAIVAMMMAVQDTSGVGYVTVGAALLAAMVSVYLFLRFASSISRILGEAGTTLLTRIAGLLLSAIAVQMMADGVLGLIG